MNGANGESPLTFPTPFPIKVMGLHNPPCRARVARATMSYRITLGFEAVWAERCVPRDMGYREAAWTALSEDAKVIARDRRVAGRFMRLARRLGLTINERRKIQPALAWRGR